MARSPRVFSAPTGKKMELGMTQDTKQKTEANLEDIAAAVERIPNDDVSWDEFKKIGMAIWSATDGSDEGFDIFDRWSQKSVAKYDTEGTGVAWHEITRSPPKDIRVGPLF